MAIFKLNKYVPEDKKTEAELNPDGTPKTPEAEVKPKEKEIFIEMNDSIADIVAKSLFANYLEAEKLDKAPEYAQPNQMVRVVSTEEINQDSIKAYKSIGRDQEICILSLEGLFHTAEEEWFLSVIPNKTKNYVTSLKDFSAKMAAIV